MIRLNTIAKVVILVGGVILILAYAYLFPDSLMPGELSEAHEDEACDDCHSSWEGVSDAKCKSCHEELETPWHNETSNRTDCTSCHVEHRKETTKDHFSADCITCHESNHTTEDLPDDCEFCHSTETWIVREISHGKLPDDCDSCHDDVHPDQDLNEYECTDCHDHPDVERIDYDHTSREVEKLSRKDDHSRRSNPCYRCHDKERFDEYNCLDSGCHGSSKEDRKHRKEDAEDWKERDCFESDCHSEDDDDDDDDDDDRGGSDTDEEESGGVKAESFIGIKRDEISVDISILPTIYAVEVVGSIAFLSTLFGYLYLLRRRHI